ncbi:MAG: helix-turn-helix transcriptional regulator [Pseudomonadota bacterium]
MEKEQVPQEGNVTLRGERKAVYALGEDGHYTLVPSAGSKVEETVTTQALAEFVRLRDEARERVIAGRASPLEYHMYDKRMDPQTLAQTTGFFTWRVRRHLKPKPFRGLRPSLLARYADALGVEPETLTRIPDKGASEE